MPRLRRRDNHGREHDRPLSRLARTSRSERLPFREDGDWLNRFGTTPLGAARPADTAEVAAVLRMCSEAGALLPPRILPDCFKGRREGHRHRFAADFEIASDREALTFLLVCSLDSRAAERDARMIVDVEKIHGPQVYVAIRNPRVDASRVDADLRVRLIGASLVDVNGAAEALEAAANRREHHVLDREFDCGVRRVDLPSRCVVHSEQRKAFAASPLPSA